MSSIVLAEHNHFSLSHHRVDVSFAVLAHGSGHHRIRGRATRPLVPTTWPWRHCFEGIISDKDTALFSARLPENTAFVSPFSCSHMDLHTTKVARALSWDRCTAPGACHTRVRRASCCPELGRGGVVAVINTPLLAVQRAIDKQNEARFCSWERSALERERVGLIVYFTYSICFCSYRVCLPQQSINVWIV